MASMVPYYALRFVAGAVFLSGAMLMFYNFVKTMENRTTVTRRIPEVRTASSAVAAVA